MASKKEFDALYDTDLEYYTCRACGVETCKNALPLLHVDKCPTLRAINTDLFRVHDRYSEDFFQCKSCNGLGPWQHDVMHDVSCYLFWYGKCQNQHGTYVSDPECPFSDTFNRTLDYVRELEQRLAEMGDVVKQLTGQMLKVWHHPGMPGAWHAEKQFVRHTRRMSM